MKIRTSVTGTAMMAALAVCATIANAQDATSSEPAVSPKANPPTKDPVPRKEEPPVSVELHGMFDNRFMLYSNNINFTTSNSRRSVSTTTATGGRGDLFQIPGPLEPDPDNPGGFSRSRQTGWQREGDFPNLPRLDGVGDNFVEIRYRPQLEVTNRDGSVRGVLQLELGGVRFGAQGVGRQQGGSFSTDATNIETRLAYTELNGLGGHQAQIGLIPLRTNRHLWQEATAGIQVSGPTWPGGGYHVAWARGIEDRRGPAAFPEDPLPSGFDDMDGFFAQLEHSLGDSKFGIFGMFQRGALNKDAEVFPQEVFAEAMALAWFGEVEHSLISAGATMALNFGSLFANADVIVQSGTFKDFDFYAADNLQADSLSGLPAPNARITDDCTPDEANCFSEMTQTGFAARLELGAALGNTRVQYTGYFMSGDDNPNDNKFKNFISTDVDFFDSAVFFEGVLVNDTVHRQEPYLFDKGFLLNKLSVDHDLTESFSFGASVVHNQLAEPVSWVGVDGRINPETGDFNFNPAGKLNPIGKTEFVEGGPPVEPFTSKDLGLEVQVRASYAINETLMLKGLFASLVAPGDAIDFFETGINRNGKADETYLTVQSSLAYSF